MENKDISQIQNLVYQALDFDLEAEVVYAALRAMKDNPNLSIVDAMQQGFNEWVK